jgi:hypothetical protein
VIFGRQGLSGTFDILDQVQDVTIQPAEGFSTLGIAFAVGDVNGDGVDDLVTGAPFAGRQAHTPPGGPRTTVGEVYVFFGGYGFEGTLTVARDQDDLRLSGEHQYDQFGADLSLADVNGDGAPDLVVGASGFDGNAGANAESGGVFVFFGSGDPLERRVASEADLAITGPAGYTLGTHVAVADLDADGKPEIGASAQSAPDAAAPELGVGRFYQVRPTAGSRAIDIGACDCVSIAYGKLPAGFFPAVAAASPDGSWFALGSPLESEGERAANGTIYLLQSAGSETPNDETSSRVLGAAAGDGLGSGVTFADINGDGTAELLALSVGVGESAPATLYAISLAD